ncbi:hypothetical protein HY733_02810 [Candidatus Uhrbacteria bacterium]|nr:hypothetical protein [Candidatus Uhrbacteria bacterium]
MARRDYFTQVQKRRYQSRQYRNPHLHSRTSIPWKTLTGVLAGCLLILGFVTFLFTNELFRITHVDVSGVESIDTSILETTITEYLHERAFLVFRRSNQFLFSSDDLSRSLEEQFALASNSMSLQGGTLFIHLEERSSNLFWKTSDRLYVVDLEGIVVREVTHPEDPILQQELPVFIDVNGLEVTIGSQVLTSTEVDAAFELFMHLNELEIAFQYLELDRLAGKWVKLVTDQGYSILLDLTGNINEQIQNLSIVLQEQVEDPSTLEYIDLRFGDKIYFK